MVRESTGNYCHKLFKIIIRHLRWSEILADFSLLSALLIRKLIIILANYQNVCFLFLPHPLLGCFRDQPPYLRNKHPDNIGSFYIWLCSNLERETWKTIVGARFFEMFVNLRQNIWLWMLSSFDSKPSFTHLNAFFAALTVSILILYGVGILQYSISWSVTVWRVCIHN